MTGLDILVQPLLVAAPDYPTTCFLDADATFANLQAAVCVFDAPLPKTAFALHVGRPANLPASLCSCLPGDSYVVPFFGHNVFCH